MTLRWAHPTHNAHGMATVAELEAAGWRVLIRPDGYAAQDPRYHTVLMVAPEEEATA